MIALLATASLMSGAALAQGLQPSGTRAGGPGQLGASGEILPEQRTYLRSYVTRQAPRPVVIQERMSPGYRVPASVELEAFPDTVYSEVPSARRYRYFSTGRDVVLVDPESRQVVEIID
jgi:hypothetical protein